MQSSGSGSGGGGAATGLLLYLDTIKPLCDIPLSIVDGCVARYERLRLRGDLGHGDTVRFAVDAGKRSGFRPTKHQIKSFEHHFANEVEDFILHRNDKNGKSSDGGVNEKKQDGEEEEEEEYGTDDVIQFDDVEERKENAVYRADENLLSTEALEYETSPREALLFFPEEHRQSLSLIADMLAFPRAVHGTRVYLLDVLTVLIILLRGSVRDKARYLFTWYNISGSGLLTELEHIVFIQRVGSVLQRMKVLGAADMSIDDAKHMAFVARAKVSPGAATTFLPGLTLRDLIAWIHECKETRVIFTFFSVLDQLVDSLCLLQNRTDALAAVLVAKEGHNANGIHVPRMNMFRCEPHGSSVYPTSRSHSTVSLCLSARDFLSTEIYVQVEKLVPAHYAFEVPPAVALMRDKHLHNKNSHVTRKVPKCCQKNFILESRRRVTVDRCAVDAGCPVMRVDIGGLDADSRYVLRAYSEQWQYAPVEVRTLPADARSSGGAGGVCILPATVSPGEAEAFVQHTPRAKAAAMLLYTGSLCSVRTLLQQSLLCFEHDALRPPAAAFVNVVTAQAALEYSYAWERQVRQLFGMFSAAGVAEDLAWDHLCTAHEGGQVAAYSGMGPWGHPDIREQTREKVGGGTFEQLSASLEALYAKFSSSVVPPSSWQLGATRVVLVRPRDAPTGGVAAEELLQLLAGSLGGSHLVVVVRSPEDLMARHSEAEAATDALEAAASSATSVERRLRGKHELLHGEHGPSPPSATRHRAAIQGSASKSKDPLLTKLLSALLEWIRQVAERKVSIVSVAWSDGCNFEVRGALARDRGLRAPVTVVHHSLLPTRVLDEAAAPQELVTQLRASALASEATFHFQATSGLRSFVVGDPPSTDIFLPYNKISDKTVDSLVSLPPIQVVSGPRTVFLSHTEVTLTFRLSGRGHVWCILYELPSLVDAVDAVSLVFAERANLREEGRVHQRCYGRAEAVVSFHCLRPYTNYCVSIEPFSEHPRVAFFRSLPMESCPLSSVVIAAVGEDDYAAPSLVLAQKVFPLFDELRCRAAGVYLIHQQLSSGRLDGAPAAPAKVDVDRSYRVGSTVHICMDSADLSHANQRDRRILDLDAPRNQPFVSEASYERVDRASGGRVHVAINGSFCKLAPRDGSAASLVELLETCEWLLRSPLSRDLRHVTVMVQRPLVRYLQKNERSGAFSVDGAFLNRREECAELFLRLLTWKAAGQGRDVIVVTLADVPSPIVVTVSLRARPQAPQPAERCPAGKSTQRPNQPSEEATPAPAPAARGYMDFDIDVKARREREQQELQQKLEEEELTDDEEDRVLLQRADRYKVAAIHGWTAEGDEHAGEGTDSEEGSVESTKTADRFSLLCPRQEHLWTQCSLRHLVLPAEERSQRGRTRATLLLPVGCCALSEHVEYSSALLSAADEAAMELRLLRPRTDLHGAVLNSEPVPAVYVLDIVAAPLQQSFAVPAPAAPSAVNAPIPALEQQPTATEVSAAATDVAAPRALTAEAPPPSLVREYFHSVTARNFMHNIDFTDITLGPLVGAVTDESAVIILELNSDLEKVEIVLRQLLVPTASAHVVRSSKEGVRCHRVFSIKATGLRRAATYEVTCPALTGAAQLGLVRTRAGSLKAATLLLCGGSCVEGLPALDTFMQHMSSYQLPDLAHLLHVYRHAYGDHVAFGGGSGPHAPRSERSSPQRANGWTWISEYFRGVMPQAEVLVQLGPQTLLPRVCAQLSENLLCFHGRISLPLADANAVASLYFAQMEEMVRETFRALLSVPTLRDALAVTPAAPLFHSDYLLPLGERLRQRTGDAGKLLQVVRTLFQAQVAAYISPLYEFDPEVMKNHMRVWRSGPLAVVLLDIVTERRRAFTKALKKKGAEGEEGEETRDKHPFSSGFIDRVQWRELKKLSKDLSVEHIIICCEKPFIAFEEIPRVHADPEGPLDKGAAPPWSPTVDDLSEFFKFWVKWVRPDEKALHTTRNVVLCAAHPFPFTTSVLDLFSGIKIPQMCVGALNRDESLGYARSNGPSHAMQQNADDMVLSGKIGSFRYVHRFDGLEDVAVNSARDTLASPIVEYNMNQEALQRPGYASVKMWFDSWKASGSWQLVSTRVGLARLTCGPVIGAPLSCKRGKMMLVPILFEVDRHCTMTIKCTNVFNAEVTVYKFKCPPNRPFVETFGPLDADTRYSFQVVSGVKANHDPTYTINTAINASESNIAIANFAAEPSKPQCSEFLLDLVNRCKVPFGGISAVVHLNVAPDLSGLVAQLLELQIFVQAVEQIRREGGVLSSGSFHALDAVMGALRAEFRSVFTRPSYAELLKSALNLIVPTSDPVNIEDVDIANARLLMLQLMVCRLHQEYYDQLNFPAENVFCAVQSSVKLRSFVLRGDREVKATDEDIEEESPDVVVLSTDDPATVERKTKNQDTYNYHMRVLAELELKSVERLAYPAKFASPKAKYFYSDPALHPVEAVFQQWRAYMIPAPLERVVWRNPNGRASVESLGPVDEASLVDVVKTLDSSPIGAGVRIIILEPRTLKETLLDAESFVTMRLHKKITTLRNQGLDRDICLVSGSGAVGGSRVVDLKYEAGVKADETGELGVVYSDALPVQNTDSIFRNNEYDRLLDLRLNAEGLAKAAKEEKRKKKKEGGGSNSKKAQQRRLDEERKAEEARLASIAATVAAWVPDGYAIVECRTSAIDSRDKKTDTLTTVATRHLNSLFGGKETEEAMYQDPESTRPHPGDYMQLPEWLVKFSPSVELFAQDEVLLIMRNEAHYKAALDSVESEDVFARIMQMYERSRLSELSRPPELREVNMAIPGVVPMLLKGLVGRIWEEAVPAAARRLLVTLKDDFVRAYCLGRAVPEPSVLADAARFARALQYSLVLSMQLKVSCDLSKREDLGHILGAMDGPARLVFERAQREQDLEAAHLKARALDPEGYDAAKIDEDFAEAERLLLSKEDYESDMEELELEAVRREAGELEAEEAEERAERLREQAEEEAELAADEAAELAEAALEKVEEEEEEGGKKDGKEEKKKEAAAADDGLTEEERESRLLAMMKQQVEMGKAALQGLEDDAVEFLLLEAVQEISRSTMEQQDADALVAAHAAQELTEEDRLAEARTHIERLRDERRAARRKLFEKIRDSLLE